MHINHIIYRDSIVQYKTFGAGKPVVLLHGFAEDSTIWQQQVEFLQADFYLIVPDIPGSGASPFIEGCNMDDYAEIVQLIIDKEIKDERPTLHSLVTVIGHSMGGYITLAFAEKYSEYLRGIGLFHSTAFADSEEKKNTRRKAIGFIKTNGAASFIKMSTPALFAQDFARAHEDKINDLITAGKNFSNEALIQYYNAMIERPDRIELLKSLNMPVLFIIGEHDTAIPFQSSLQQCYLPNESHVTILKQSAHMGMWEETDKSNKALSDFLLVDF
jgi:pimeloyl-ACP methyl ester carboxylesterase